MAKKAWTWKELKAIRKSLAQSRIFVKTYGLKGALALELSDTSTPSFCTIELYCFGGECRRCPLNKGKACDPTTNEGFNNLVEWYRDLMDQQEKGE